MKFVDLKDQRRNRMASIGLQNLIYTNVVSSADFPGLSEQFGSAAASVGLPVNQPIRKKPSRPMWI